MNDLTNQEKLARLDSERNTILLSMHDDDKCKSVTTKSQVANATEDKDSDLNKKMKNYVIETARNGYAIYKK